MGIPYKKLICASNTNNVITDVITSGCYDISDRRLLQTMSPAIDILVSSNLERLLYSLSDNDPSFTRTVFKQLRDKRKFQVPSHVILRFIHFMLPSYDDIFSYLYRQIT